jgi:hypothetical protein
MALWQSITASFECRDQAAALELVEALNRTDLAAGFVVDSREPVVNLRSRNRGPNERLPETHHLRWTRGRVITDVTIFATERRRAAENAADIIVRSAGYPPYG